MRVMMLATPSISKEAHIKHEERLSPDHCLAIPSMLASLCIIFKLDHSPSLLTKPALSRLGREFALVDLADACCRGALVKILDKVSQRIFTALGFALDSAIRCVLHPSSHAHLLGLFAGVVPETDALDLALDLVRDLGYISSDVRECGLKGCSLACWT